MRFLLANQDGARAELAVLDFNLSGGPTGCVELERSALLDCTDHFAGLRELVAGTELEAPRTKFYRSHEVGSPLVVVSSQTEADRNQIITGLDMNACRPPKSARSEPFVIGETRIEFDASSVLAHRHDFPGRGAPSMRALHSFWWRGPEPSALLVWVDAHAVRCQESEVICDLPSWLGSENPEQWCVLKGCRPRVRASYLGSPEGRARFASALRRH